MLPDDGYNWLRWLFSAIALVLTCGRFYIRWRFFKQFRWDDLFHGLAFMLFIACFVVYVEAMPYPDGSAVWLQYNVAFAVLLWTTLYLVKASFLAFCWSIFRISPTFRKAWWAVTIYTFLTYWPTILYQFWQSGDPSKYADPVAFAAHEEQGFAQYAIIGTGMDAALHASSEILILILPLVFIKKLNMSLARKISAAVVFAIVIVDIVLGILRNISTLCFFLGYALEVNYNIYIAMAICEPGTAIMVCALPAYRVLLPSSRSRRDEQMRLARNAANMGEGSPTPRKSKSSGRSGWEGCSISELDSVHMV